MIEILIVDDHPIFRLGLKEFLSQKSQFRIIGEAGTGEDAIALARELNPHIVIMDTDVPKTNGIDATNQILKQNPSIKVIALSHFDDDNEVMEMLKAGSKGLIFKSGEMEEVIQAVEKVAANEEFYSKEAVEVIINRFARGNPEVKALLKIPGFSDREMDIIKLVCLQKTAKEIGHLLFISEKTVDFHRQKIIEKMSVKNIIGLVLYAIKNGLVNINDLELTQ
ncbi:response regulator transcription factor [Taibaiella helva]|uniref:response regulator transcription factor n=1 Tax=Taibaiella helva TaxID=2301235 RepID=UPI000E594A95|nr:response regulator transcription factor [Taibaiella helva]